MTPPMNSVSRNRFDFPDLGLGIGLRRDHYQHILDERPSVDWFEILTENYMNTEGRPVHVLEQVAERYPVVLHGVSMSIGSTDPVDFEYLAELKALAERVKAVWLGDHVCWTGIAGHTSHDLLPMPYTEATLTHIVDRIRTVQEVLERPIVLENPSSYVEFKSSTMREEEFMARMSEEADCALLLDVNNVYVSSRNHGFDPVAYLDAIPFDRVVQIHLAGHADNGTHCIDTHGGPVIDPVWELYAEVCKRTGPVATLLEWDQNIPSFPEVQAELEKAHAYRDQVSSPGTVSTEATR